MAQRVLLRFGGVLGRRHIVYMNSSVKTMLGEEEVIWKVCQVPEFPYLQKSWHSLVLIFVPSLHDSASLLEWLFLLLTLAPDSCSAQLSKHQQTFTKSTLAPFEMCVSNLPSWSDLLLPSHLSSHQGLLCARSQQHTCPLSMDCLSWPLIIPFPLSPPTVCIPQPIHCWLLPFRCSVMDWHCLPDYPKWPWMLAPRASDSGAKRTKHILVNSSGNLVITASFSKCS